MTLIRKLECRKNKTGKNSNTWGLFLCPFCSAEVERQLGGGKKQKSCGCSPYLTNKGNTKHGKTKSRLFRIWSGMKFRCLNSNNKDYKNYGGRGISICDEWINNFENFYKWSSVNGYKHDLSIDRINNDGNYTPDNCRFVTNMINSQNRRINKLTPEKANQIRQKYFAMKYEQWQLAKEYNTCQANISQIVRNKTWVNIAEC